MNEPESNDIHHLCRWSLFVLLVACFVCSTHSMAAQVTASAYTFTTFAGHPGGGSADGVGSAAQFYSPSGVAVDSAGNTYVADNNNHTIRKITSAGVVTTIAGLAGVSGGANGTNSTARFFRPSGIAADSAGNLYVGDAGNCIIRKITLMENNWVVTTIAGQVGSVGYADGTNDTAQFNSPQGIAVDVSGNLYVVDTVNEIIRKITRTGTNWVVSSIIANLGRYPHGVAVDSATNVYVASTDDCTIRKITPAGAVSIIAGLSFNCDSADGTNNTARFNTPSDVAVDSTGNLYVTDRGNSTIRKITPIGTNWVVSTFAGRAGLSGSANGTGTNALFVYPVGITLDLTGNIYVADPGNNTIRKITSAGVVSTIAGSASSSGSTDGTGNTARFYRPQDVSMDHADNVYVADSDNNTIRKITSAGVVSTIAGEATISGSDDGVGNNARFNSPSGVTADTWGNVYVADTGNCIIRKINPAGVVSTIAGMAGNCGGADGTDTNALFSSPHGIAVDSLGKLYIADTFNHTIRQVTLAGTNWVVSTIAGGVQGSSDGTNSAAQFREPKGIAADSGGNLYVADTGNHKVRKVTPLGTNWVVSTIAGGGHEESRDGTNNAARFDDPKGIALDSAGNIYVSDALGYTIRKIAPVGTNWVVSTISGLYYNPGSNDGAGSAARFGTFGSDYGPSGVAVDSAGNVYVADAGNNTIRKGVFTAYSTANAVAFVRPPMNAQLQVTLLPSEAGGQWRFPWELGWHNSSEVVTNLVAGNYPIEFRNVSGYLAIPQNLPAVQVTNGGITFFSTNIYYPTIPANDPNSGSGTLSVHLGPTPPSGAGWRFLGNNNASWLPSNYTTNLAAGTYLIGFATVGGRVTPPNMAVQIKPGLPTPIAVNYLLAQSPLAGVLLPFPVPSNQITNLNSYPFGFNGQLQTDVGNGSGVAVQENVVLTAAHLVFNDQTLSYVSQAFWYFQKEAGVFEPQPMQARSYYVLGGYAALRTNEMQSGLYAPGQSTPQSRNMDVAALYFQSPVAGGGYGGYLPSDESPNSWLASTSLKMLVGYPVNGSVFGSSNIVPGVMYQTDPQPYPLSLSTDPVANQRVYTAPWFLSYPGNSGGPLYVQFNGYYYPAGVYLGTLYSGITPYASVVRAIDGDVVNLITNAAAFGANGTNNNSGGVLTIIPSLAISASNVAFVQWHLAPPAAVQAGAEWRLAGDATYSGNVNYTRVIESTNAVVVQFKDIPGWNVPTNQMVTVLPGFNEPFVGFYTVTNPVLVADRNLGLGITGTTGTVYAIERGSSLTSGTWVTVLTNTILSNGFNLVLPNPATNGPANFYRAKWLDWLP